MDEFNKVIYSKEKNTARGMYIIAAFLSIPVVFIVGSALINNDGLSRIFFALPFAAFVLLLTVIGKFQQKKYDRLGKTPLTLMPSFCTLGEQTHGAITIPKENFKKVNKLTLTCLRQSSTNKNSDSMTSYEQVWTGEIAPVMHFLGNETKLEFDILIPTGSKPTSSRYYKTYKYHWELSFEYVEAMDSIKRTWQIPVVEGYQLTA